jgi:hypothetical protein
MSKRTSKAKLTHPCNDANGDAIISAAPEADGAPAQPASSELDVRPSNRQICLDLLARPSGAGIAEIGTATGWLPHSTRAVLSRLRKEGHVIERRPGTAGQVTHWILKAGE